MSESRVGVSVAVVTPIVPNFLILPGGGSIDVADLSDEDLKRIAQRWTEALLDKAKERRKNPPQREGPTP